MANTVSKCLRKQSKFRYCHLHVSCTIAHAQKKNGRIGEASKENSPLNVCQTNKG